MLKAVETISEKMLDTDVEEGMAESIGTVASESRGDFRDDKVQRCSNKSPSVPVCRRPWRSR